MQSLHTALSNMRRSPYQALTASMMMTLTFFIAYCFVVVLYGSHLALRYLESRPQVTAFFAVNTTQEVVAQAAEMMKQKAYVANVKMISNQEALNLFREQNKKDPLLLELVSADILPASIEVSGKDISNLQQIRDDLSTISGVDEVIYQKDVIDNLSLWTKNIRIGGIAITSILLFVTILFVFVILSLRVAMKRTEIGIMRLLGASGWYIRGPFLMEGVLYGLLGATVGWVLTFILALYITPSVVRFFGPMLPSTLPLHLLLVLLAVGMGSGMLFGVVASFFAVKRLSKS